MLNSDVELRPSLLRSYAPKTLACYEDRLIHYQRWCSLTGFQAGPEFITTEKVLDYVRDQIERWASPDDPDADDYRLLRPETIKQAVNALVYWGERAAEEPPDARGAKELLRRFTEKFNAEVPPAWRVAGRKSPRRRRPRAPRPQPEQQQSGLFDLDTSA